MGSMVSKVLFQPPRPSSYSTTPHFFWLFTKRGDKIPAFYISVAEKTPQTATLLFSHGNAEDLGMLYDWFREVSRLLKVNVMAYDYSGYGLSSAESPSEDAVYADAEAALAYLVSVVNTPHNQIVLYGRSLGGGPSTYLAQKMSDTGDPPRGVVLQSPFLSAYRVAFHFRFSMPGDQFCNVDRIGDIMCPVYVIHGTNDEVVPFWNGQELYLKVREEFRYPAFWVKDAGHNNIELLLRDSTKLSLFFVKFKEFLKCTADRRGEYEALAATAREEARFSGSMCCGPRVGRGEAGRSTREAGRSTKKPGVTDALKQGHGARGGLGGSNNDSKAASEATDETKAGGALGEAGIMSGSVTPGWK